MLQRSHRREPVQAKTGRFPVVIDRPVFVVIEDLAGIKEDNTLETLAFEKREDDFPIGVPHLVTADTLAGDRIDAG